MVSSWLYNLFTSIIVRAAFICMIIIIIIMIIMIMMIIIIMIG